MEFAPPDPTSLSQFYFFLAQLLSFSEAELYALFGVFIRVGAVVGLLPGFGERMISIRIRLVAAIAFTVVVWPVVMDAAVVAMSEVAATTPISSSTVAPIGLASFFLAETAVGLSLGIAIRFFVFALQLAGSMAAQATAVAQVFGGGGMPDPMPAIGNFLTIGGIAVALAAGLHIKAVTAMITSYQVLPFGVFPIAGDLAEWGVRRASQAFELAFTLAAPFVVASLVYNVALGAINRAMPQLMVAFVGAPAITAGALFFLFLAGPVGLLHWSGALDLALAMPFGTLP
ncbi:MAG: flagellar biosynthetic protein FliR [Pseudomonadota bacterium]